jgi:NAD(P)-dependent dehydrogenase (short-subunit alcohol dehydrogenase family)
VTASGPRAGGRVALVTGAGRGIGRATALGLAGAGARVLAVSRTEADLESLAAEAPIEPLAETVATEEGRRRIVDEARRRLGPVEILVLNAGIGSYREDVVWRQDPDVWHETLAVNLDAPFHLTRMLAGDMVAAGWGRIVMVASTAGQTGGFRMSAYCASKHGLLGLMRSVALDVAAANVTCNAVAPGWVTTPMADRSAEREATERGVTAEQVWRERAAANPAGRVASPAEVAAAIGFLASEEASGINGETITVSLGAAW